MGGGGMEGRGKGGRRNEGRREGGREGGRDGRTKSRRRGGTEGRRLFVLLSLPPSPSSLLPSFLRPPFPRPSIPPPPISLRTLPSLRRLVLYSLRPLVYSFAAPSLRPSIPQVTTDGWTKERWDGGTGGWWIAGSLRFDASIQFNVTSI